MGGTKTAVGLVEFAKESSSVFTSRVLPTFEGSQRGFDSPEELRAFFRRIAKTAIDLIAEAEKSGVPVSAEIGIGAPGRFRDGATLPSPNPGFGNYYDGVEFSKIFLEEFRKVWAEKGREPRRWKISADNDGSRQRDYAIYEAARNDDAWALMKGKKVAFLGLGTGVAGGFAKLSIKRESGLVEQFYTDSHIGDLQLPNGHLVGDFICGRSIEKNLGINGRELSQNIQRYHEYIVNMGAHLGRVMETIYLGEGRKAWGPWPEEYYAQIKGTSVFVLGGSIGTNGPVAKIIQDEARAYLKSRGLHNIHLIPVARESAEAGIVGAAIPNLMR